MHSAESKSKSSLVAFKETIRRNPFWGEHIYHEKKNEEKNLDLLINFFYVRGVSHNFVNEYLDEIETEFENTSACYQGPRWV